MLPGAHVGIGLFLSFILGLDPLLTFVCIVGSIVPDLDFLIGFIMKKNHRLLVTHTPFFWCALLLVSLLLLMMVPQIAIFGLIFSVGALLHVLIDSVDWGVMLFYPLKRTLNPHVLEEPMNPTSLSFLATNFRNTTTLVVELSLWMVGIFSLFLIMFRWFILA